MRAGLAGGRDRCMGVGLAGGRGQCMGGGACRWEGQPTEEVVALVGVDPHLHFTIFDFLL